MYNLSISDQDFFRVRKIVHEHSNELRGYIEGNARLQFVKRIKDLSGLGLKESKDFSDLIFDKIIPLDYITEERRKKLEKLARRPLVESIVDKIKNFSHEDLISVLLKFDVGELLRMDEIFDGNQEKKNE